MSISGHNISPSSSDFVPPTYLELEATAAAQLPKINLAIVDTLQHPFTEVQKHDLWKYQSAAPRPSLPPAHNIRIANPDTQAKESDTWKGEYQKLIENLPEIVQEALKENRNRPIEEQFTSLVALDNALATTARAIATIDSAALPPLPGTSADYLRHINEQLPVYADNNYRSITSEILGSVEAKIADLTPNHSDFDRLNYFNTLMGEGLKALDQGGDA